MSETLNVVLSTAHDPMTDDLLVQVRITPQLLRSADEWKWRVTQAVVMALSKYEGAV